MKRPPKISLETNIWDSLATILVPAIFIGVFFYIFIVYGALPEEIPIHFDANGKADGWGAKNTIFIVPLIGFPLALLMNYLCRFPHTFNYTKRITLENAEFEYRKAVDLMRQISLALAWIFAFITYTMVHSSTVGSSHIPSVVFLPAILLPVCLPIVFYFLKRQ